MTKTLKCEEFKVLEDGKHEGIIKEIVWREQPYQYMDVVIETVMDNQKVAIKVGYPQKYTPTNKTGQMFSRFGVTNAIDLELDPEQLLVGKRCQFITIQNRTTKGTFANIVQNSLQPVQ